MIDLSLYVITTEVKEKKRSHLDVARAALEGGATVIQFREKSYTTLELYNVALKLRDLTASYRRPLIINDRLDIALAVEADGVHLGWDDLPFDVAFKFKGQLKIIGLSTRNLKETKLLNRFSPAYLGAGPVFPTPSKSDATNPFGLQVLRKIVEKSRIPVIAIGGISLENVDQVLKCGVQGVALISAIALADDMTEATLKFKEKLKLFKRRDDELVGKN